MEQPTTSAAAGSGAPAGASTLSEQSGSLREVDLLCNEIAADRQQKLSKSIGKSRKRERMAFGDIHDCDRRNTYSMIEGDQRPRWDEYVQAKLDAGKKWELLMKTELSELGYEPKMADQEVTLKNKSGEIIARGFTDLCLERKTSKTRFPVEIKQMQIHMFDSITTWRDLLRNPWTKKYLRQLLLYMFSLGKDEGLFLLGDFQGHWKLIPVYLDYDLVDDIIKKVETANEARRTGVLPDRIPYDNMLCGRCDFMAVCIPDINAVPAQKIEGNAALAKLLEVREANMEAWQKVQKANATIKAFFEDVKEGVFTVGNFIINRKAGQRKTYPIPPDVKEKYLVMADTYKNEIERFAQPDPETIFLEPKRGFDFEENNP